MYWYMCRLDASHRCLVVNKDPPFVAVHFVAFVVVPADARFVAVPVVSVIMSWCSINCASFAPVFKMDG